MSINVETIGVGFFGGEDGCGSTLICSAWREPMPAARK
jgi:hypothetical protein